MHQCLEREVSFILVNRYNLSETPFDEIQQIDNKRLTLQVQFYGEVSFLNFNFLILQWVYQFLKAVTEE